tara:strand:- start:185 stop:1426 length:1242 start_codon:yes stop_codon:yes gene_type:complete
MSVESKFKNFFFISFLLVIIGTIIENYIFITGDKSLFIDPIYSLFIILSIIIILMKFNSQNYFIDKRNFIYIILLAYCFFQFVRPPVENIDQMVSNYWLSKFGGPYFDVIFLIPIFFLWANNYNALYWFEKLSLLSIKVGILSIPFSMINNSVFLYAFFFPSYYLLAGFKHSSKTRKAWIIMGLLAGFFSFYAEHNRAGIARILITICFLLLFRIANYSFFKIVLLSIFIFPFYIFFSINYFDHSFFSAILNLFQNTDSSNNFFIDTRSFLFIEIFNHFKNDGNIFIGNGGFANYYTYWFDFISSFMETSEGKYRLSMEVGFLSILLKGGIVYLLLHYLLIYQTTTYAVNNSKNIYLKNLSVIAISFLFTSSYENVLAFDTLNVSFWIILSLLYSKKIINLSNEDIQTIFKKL